MRKILVKLAHYILRKYSLEKEPFLYFNGAEYQAIGTEYKHKPDGDERLIVTAKRK